MLRDTLFVPKHAKKGLPILNNSLRPMRSAIVVLTLLLVFLSILPSLAYPVTVVDGRGKRVTIKSAPRRIISLSPNSTEILFALGLGARVVGDTAWCNYPPAAKSKPHIGDSKISMEKVIALKPDLILAHAFVNSAYIGRLEAAGKTVIAFDPKTYGEVIADIRMVGHATDADA
jgi:iron complex transport system substrate-binding protein